MSDDTKTHDLDVLFPGVDVPINLRGKGPETVRVEPFYATQFSAAITKSKPIIKAMSSVFYADGESIRLQFNGDFADFLARVFDSVDNGTSAVIDLLAVALRKPREWFDDVSLDGLCDLAEAVYSQNKDFFGRRVLPMFRAWAPKAQPTGEPSTPDSSAPATAETASTE